MSRVQAPAILEVRSAAEASVLIVSLEICLSCQVTSAELRLVCTSACRG
jgi:hypothetical protein